MMNLLRLAALHRVRFSLEKSDTEAMGIPKIPQAEHELRARAEREALVWATLKRYTKKAGFKKPDAKVTVFDLACGSAEEALALACYFSSGLPGIPTPKCELYLVEAQAQLLDFAKETFSQPLPGARFSAVPNVKCLVGDCQDLSTLALPDTADFILIRHQFIGKDRDDKTDVWGKIFTSALSKLAPQGRLLITSFSQEEHDLALERLKTVEGARVLCEEKNPHSIPLHDTRPIAGDNFVIVLRSEH